MRIAISVVLLAACNFNTTSEVATEPVAEIEAAPAVAMTYADAPALEVSSWVKGDAVDADTGLVLIEQWATWCGPCVKSIPHMTALQAKYGDQLTVVGVTDEEAEVVEPFVQRKGDEMAYAVALTTEEANAPWFEQAGDDGIPRVWLLQDGKVLWTGHPNHAERVTDAVIAGEWSPEINAHVAAATGAGDAYLEAAKAGALEGMADLAETLRSDEWIGSDTRNEVAWIILTEVEEAHRDLDLALELSTSACAATDRESWAFEDTLALAKFKKGLVAEAATTQQNAIRLCEAADAGDACDELRERLATFSAG